LQTEGERREFPRGEEALRPRGEHAARRGGETDPKGRERESALLVKFALEPPPPPQREKEGEAIWARTESKIKI